MTLQLDVRQRAMLAEMGIRVFAPQARAPDALPVAEAPPTSVRAAPVAAQPVVRAPGPSAPAPAPVRATVAAGAPSDLDALDWESLQAAVAAQLPAGSGRLVFGAGDAQGDWLVVGDPPGDEEALQGQPFVGDPGRLLDNMLAAVGASRRRGAYLTHVMKWRPAGQRNPEPADLAQAEPFLRRQVALVQPRMILAMGRFATQMLLATTEPAGKLRGRVHAYLGVPVVVTFHPAYLLRNPADKARAWADLCLAQSVLRG